MMEQLTDHHYEVLTVPEESAANCIYIKGPSKRDFLLHRPAEECPDSVSVSTALLFRAGLRFKIKDYRSIIIFWMHLLWSEAATTEIYSLKVCRLKQWKPLFFKTAYFLTFTELIIYQ